MTRLILIRHGQSIANAEHIFAGHSDFDLTDFGHEQARRAARYLRERESIDAIYASDLLRAYHTACPIAEAFGLPIVKDTTLREIFAGEWDGHYTDDIETRFPEDFHRWKTDYSHVRCTGGESIPEVYGRIVPHICALAEENDGKCILLATHATVVRSFDAFAKGYSAEETGSVPFSRNASINIYEYENGNVTPVCSDLVEHLGELVTGLPKKLDS